MSSPVRGVPAEVSGCSGEETVCSKSVHLGYVYPVVEELFIPSGD